MTHTDSSDKLQIVTSDNVQVDVVINYFFTKMADTFTEQEFKASYSTAATNDIDLGVASPVTIKSITIYNADATPLDVTLQKTSGVNTYGIFKLNLNSDQTIFYDGLKYTTT